MTTNATEKVKKSIGSALVNDDKRYKKNKDPEGYVEEMLD